jgi:RNA polymerase sigma factor (sigma-70 family)
MRSSSSSRLSLQRGGNLPVGSRPLVSVDVAELVRGAQRGDVLAMSQLLDALAPYVGRICGAIALGAGEDAAQETLISVFRRLRSLREPEALYGWVRTIAVREAMRLARPPAPTARVAPGDLPGDVAPVDPEIVGDVRRVLERLAPEQRAILVLRDLHGLDEAEAARVLGVARGTVKSRLHRARAVFRREWTT